MTFAYDSYLEGEGGGHGHETGYYIGINQKSTNELANFKPHPFEWPSSNQLSRQHEIILARLRIGHTRHTHSHILSNLFPLSCDFCDPDSPLNISHIFECPALDNERKKFQIPPSIKLALSDNLPSLPNILPFLKDTNYLNRI